MNIPNNMPVSTSIAYPVPIASEATSYEYRLSTYDKLVSVEKQIIKYRSSSDYATIAIADAAIEQLEKIREQLLLQIIEEELDRKVTIIKKPNKTLYRVCIRENGKRKQLSSTTVDGLYEKVLGNPVHFGADIKPDITLQDIYNLYSKNNHMPIIDNEGNVTYPTSTALRKDQAWKKYWGRDIIVSMPIRAIVVGDIIDAFKRLTASRRYTARQITQAKSVLKQTFDHAIWLKLIESNPVISMPNNSCPKRASSTHKKATTVETRVLLESYLSSLPRQTVYTLAIRFWLNIMQRSGEWRALTWNDVDFKKGTIIVRHSITKREVNGRLITFDDEHLKADELAREIEITDKAIAILKELYLINGQKHYVFNSSRQGKHPIPANRLNQKIKEYCIEVGIEPLSTHCQRRGAIQDAYTAGLPEDQIRATAGHSDSTMTRYYNKNNNCTLSKELQAQIFG